MGISTRGQILNDSSKFLFFRDANDDYTCLPVNNLTGFSESGSSATELIVYFLPLTRHDSGFFEHAILTVTNHEDAIRAIMDAINFSKKTIITVADDVNSDYLDSSISGTTGAATTATANLN